MNAVTSIKVVKRELSLEQRVEALETISSKSARAIEKLRYDLDQERKKLAFVDAHASAKHLDSIERRMADLSRRVQIELLKIDVTTEVPRVYPDILPALFLALDLPSEWWQLGSTLTIQEWGTRIRTECGHQ